MRRAPYLLIALALTCAPGRPARAELDDNSKKSVEFKMTKVDETLKEILERADRWKADGKLEEADKRSELYEQADRMYFELAESYAEATAVGWGVSDPVMAAAKAKLEELATKLAPTGFWTCWKLDEPMIHERGNLDVCRRLGTEAEWYSAKGIPGAEDARKDLESIDRLLKQMLDASKEKPDRPSDEATADLPKNPTYLRALQEIDRLKAAVQANLAKADTQREDVAKDFKGLADLGRDLYKVEGLMNMLGSGSAECTPESAIALETYDRDFAPRIEKTLAEFGKKYGTDYDKLFDFQKTIFGDTWDTYKEKFQFEDPASQFGDLGKLAAAAQKIRTECGESKGQSAKQDLDLLPEMSGEAITVTLVRASETINLGLRFDPKSAELAKLKDSLGPREKELKAGLEKKIDEARLAPSIAKFEGPGTVESLAAAAKTYFDESDWYGKAKNPYTLVSVSITGQWESNEKNLLGETIQWEVPFEAAFIRPSDTDATIAYKVSGNLHTAEERGVQKAPPFKGHSQGDPVKMRRANLAGAGGS